MTQVLLYSGGMDSFIAAHFYPEAKLVYMNTRSRYSEKELVHLHRLAPRPVIVDNRLDLSKQERDDLIVPGRNIMLTALAATYGEDILLAATAGDNSRDKDFVFAGRMSDVLSWALSGEHFPDGNKYKVYLPFKAATKAMMVHDYLAAGYDPVKLSETISCYHPTIPHCGMCKACVRKWVALEHNHCDHTPWLTRPEIAPIWEHIIPRILNREHIRGPAEDNQTLSVLAKFRPDLFQAWVKSRDHG